MSSFMFNLKSGRSHSPCRCVQRHTDPVFERFAYLTRSKVFKSIDNFRIYFYTDRRKLGLVLHEEDMSEQNYRSSFNLRSLGRTPNLMNLFCSLFLELTCPTLCESTKRFPISPCAPSPFTLVQCLDTSLEYIHVM